MPKIQKIYVRQNWVEKQVRPAPIYEYSYDFANKSNTQVTNDWWTFIMWNNYTSYSSDWMTSTSAQSIMLKREDLSQYLTNAKKVILTFTSKWSDYWLWYRLYRVATSSTRADITWTYIDYSSSAKIEWHIYWTSWNQSVTRNDYINRWVTQTCVIDFDNKKMTITNDVWFSKELTMTDTQISNIKNNSIWHYTWPYLNCYLKSLKITIY